MNEMEKYKCSQMIKLNEHQKFGLMRRYQLPKRLIKLANRSKDLHASLRAHARIEDEYFFKTYQYHKAVFTIDKRGYYEQRKDKRDDT